MFWLWLAWNVRDGSNGFRKAAIVILGLHLLMAGLIPMLWLLAPGTRAAFERRAERRPCVTCGYDLRASPDRCPQMRLAEPDGGRFALNQRRGLI